MYVYGQLSAIKDLLFIIIIIVYLLLLPLYIKSYNFVPGWNKYVKEHHLHARDALWWWNLNKKPRYGLIYEAMRTTVAQFKYALRFVKSRKILL